MHYNQEEIDGLGTGTDAKNLELPDVLKAIAIRQHSCEGIREHLSVPWGLSSFERNV
jgi:hypothetical protein